MALLELFGPLAVWQPAARLGRWSPAQGPPQEVGVLVGPEGATAESLARARARAAGVLRLRTRGVLPLLDVCLVEGRLAWVYQKIDAVGLFHAVGTDTHRTMLSTRAAAEVVAEVAEVLVSCGTLAPTHPGPEPTDLLLDRRGRLHLLGFVGPFAPSPATRAPNLGSAGDEEALVYRLGVLLSHLVSGVPPAAPTEHTAHSSLVRRALIRAMARPGPVLTERYGDWLRGMLAWEPSSRPLLSTVAPGLRKVGEDTGGPDLIDWADAYVEELRASATRPAPRPRPAPSPIVYSEIGESQATEEVPRTRPAAPLDAFPDAADDSEGPTVIQASGGDSVPTFVPDEATQEHGLVSRTSAPRPEPPDAIPVAVGPPPEALPPTPRLPQGFLDSGPHPLPRRGPSLSDELPDEWQDEDASYWLWPALMAMAITGLALLALILLSLVAITHARRSASPSQGPSLEEALPLAIPAEEQPPPPSVDTVVEVESEPLPPPPPPSQREEAPPEPAPAPSPEVAPAPTEARGPFRVVFRSTDPGVDLSVACNEVSGQGVGRVELVLPQRGPCVVTADVDGDHLRAHVSVTGPAELTCFAGDQPSCRF